jgi:hypothetical protein
MMTNTVKCLILFLTLGLMIASAATYNVTLFQPSTIAGKELKPGDYKLSVENGTAVLSMGKEKIETPVKLETSDAKYSSTSVRYTTDSGKMKVTEIRLGGTTTKVLFN